jgi:hypothetical protein
MNHAVFHPRNMGAAFNIVAGQASGDITLTYHHAGSTQIKVVVVTRVLK